MHEYGAQAALPIWIQYMRSALANTPESTMPEPPDIITVRIDPRSGLLAAPEQSNAIFEIFRKDHQPTQLASPSSNSGNFSSGTADHSDDESDSEPLF